MVSAARRRPVTTPVPLPQTWADRDDAELTARTKRLRSGERYDGVHLTGAAHAGTYCPDVRLLECAVRGRRWDDATLSGSVFIDVLLDEVAASTLTVTSSTWRDVLCRGCRLGAVQAYGSSWHGVGIEGVGELSGATISEQHLRDLARPMARLLGIAVDDDEDRPPAE